MPFIVDVFINNNENIINKIFVGIDHLRETTVYTCKLAQRIFRLTAAMKVRQICYNCKFIIRIICWGVF